MAFLYADYYQKRYKVSFCSWISLVWLCFLALCLAVPYYMCWVT